MFQEILLPLVLAQSGNRLYDLCWNKLSHL